jgi:hypothetical protein
MTKKNDLSKPIMASGITMWSVEISYGCKKKNVNRMLGFLKKQKMSLVNLIIYIF